MYCRYAPCSLTLCFWSRVMCSKKEKHPLEKSLAVFPLVPQSKQNLVSDSVSYRAEVGRKHALPEYHRMLPRLQPITSSSSVSSNNNTNNNNNNDDNSKTQHRRSGTKRKGKWKSEENPYYVTRRKLDLAAKYLPKKSDSLTFKLPPILSLQPDSLQDNKEGKTCILWGISFYTGFTDFWASC